MILFVSRPVENLGANVRLGVGKPLLGPLNSIQNGETAMSNICRTCKHDQRFHHNIGGCCFKIPPYINNVKTCNCDKFQ